MMNALAFILAELLEHADLIMFIIDTVKGKKLTQEDVRKAVEDAITAAYDVKVKSELGL